MLICWTTADSGLIKRTLGETLRGFRPDVPKHRFEPLKEGHVPLPEAGEVVLACGNKALEEMRRAGLIPKNRSLGSMRETLIKRQGGGSWLLTYDPGVTNSEPEKKEVLDWDLRLAVRYMRTGSLRPNIGKYEWVNSFQPTIDWIEAQYAKTGKAVDVSCDTETEGLHPWYPDRDIVSISFTAQPKTAQVLYIGRQTPPIALDPTIPLFDQIKWLLTSPKVKLRLSNGKYDMVWIAEKWGIECTNFRFDNNMVGSLLDENRSNSLNLHAKVFTDMGGYDDDFNAKYDKGKMGEIPVSKEKEGADFLTYAGGDTDAAQRVADVLRDQLLEDPQLARFYQKIAHPAVRAFERVERRGILVDQQKYAVLRDDLVKTIDENTKKAMDLLPPKLRFKFKSKIDSQLSDGKDPLVDALLKDYFFTPYGLNLKPKLFTPKPDKDGNPKPSMKKAHLRMFGDVPGAKSMVDVLTVKDIASKTLSTFVDGFLKHLRPDGCFHPSYMLFHGDFNDQEDEESGSVSGRLAAKEPAIQTVPKKKANVGVNWAKRLRECFIAPPGKVILQVDYSQGELKVVACIAPEKTMIQSYLSGLDLHAVTGAKLASTPLDEFLKWKDSEDKELASKFDEARSRAKPANFGLLYGMGAEGFQAYAWANYGLKLTLEEATIMRAAFFELYPGLIGYHENMRKFVKLNEYVRSPLGRVRHLPTIRAWDQAIRSKAERQAINSPVQSTLTDMMIWAIALIEAEMPDQLDIVAMIHDAFIAYVDADKIVQVASQVSEIMSNLPLHELDWEPQLKFTCDAEYGPNLAQLEKLKLAVAA